MYSPYLDSESTILTEQKIHKTTENLNINPIFDSSKNNHTASWCVNVAVIRLFKKARLFTVLKTYTDVFTDEIT